MKAHVSEDKKKIVSEFVRLIKGSPIIGAVDMENLPAPQLQAMREQLRGSVKIMMTKRRLMEIALENAKESVKNIDKLTEHLRGMPALIFTKENPFKLYKVLNKNKSKAPAKAGQTAPNDIIVPEGPTPFAPGPIIGELGALGLKTGVENGKVAIKEASVVVKEGDIVDAKTAEVLTRLDIKPMEVGLNLIAVYEDGEVFKKDVLAIDEDEYIGNIIQASKWAFNLAVESAYPTKETTEFLLSKAFNDAKSIGLEANIIADAIVEDLLGKAKSQCVSLKNTAGIEIVDKVSYAKEVPVKKEEKPAETSPEKNKEESKENKTPLESNIREDGKVEEPKQKETAEKESKEKDLDQKDKAEEHVIDVDEKISEEKTSSDDAQEANEEIVPEPKAADVEDESLISEKPEDSDKHQDNTPEKDRVDGHVKEIVEQTKKAAEIKPEEEKKDDSRVDAHVKKIVEKTKEVGESLPEDKAEKESMVDSNVQKIVEQTKKQFLGEKKEEPTAQDLLEETESKEKGKIEIKKENDVPKAEDLAKQKQEDNI